MSEPTTALGTSGAERSRVRFGIFDWIDERLTQRGGWESFRAQGGIYVGAPATVRAQLQHALDVTGGNYFAGAFAFGNLTPEQALRSLRLFVAQVMPTFR